MCGRVLVCRLIVTAYAHGYTKYRIRPGSQRLSIFPRTNSDIFFPLKSNRRSVSKLLAPPTPAEGATDKKKFRGAKMMGTTLLPEESSCLHGRPGESRFCRYMKMELPSVYLSGSQWTISVMYVLVSGGL